MNIFNMKISSITIVSLLLGRNVGRFVIDIKASFIDVKIYFNTYPLPYSYYVF